MSSFAPRLLTRLSQRMSTRLVSSSTVRSVVGAPRCFSSATLSRPVRAHSALQGIVAKPLISAVPLAAVRPRVSSVVVPRVSLHTSKPANNRAASAEQVLATVTDTLKSRCYYVHCVHVCSIVVPCVAYVCLLCYFVLAWLGRLGYHFKCLLSDFLLHPSLCCSYVLTGSILILFLIVMFSNVFVFSVHRQLYRYPLSLFSQCSCWCVCLFVCFVVCCVLHRPCVSCLD
jgi:hypothetical protein